ncbi:Glycosyl transferase family 2 [Nitrospira sp. KM1]|uniref:glycosyltransferase family 2 protein n=1 Tax=Nitrospira sp. KM1 TaxID=1936990 RepID=UPI0013A72089|nr:glycosyltransferase family 2 protein [Nitrospira sp. KM1]BCA54105.1 Glycosyl transferase family 2 [Nitrospira sp. KM1]
MMIEIVFWISVAFVLYAYAGYPLVLALLGLFHRKVVKKEPIQPSVAFVITAFNEEKRIQSKLLNTLEQDYPKDRMDIVVASDCSVDKTDEIVQAFASSGVRLVRLPLKGGKEAAQKFAVESTESEVLIFSDVATTLRPNAVATIVTNFADPSVGCVSSVDRFVDKDGRVSGEGAYVAYEMLLRRLESSVNSLVGLSGSFFAARREVCRNWAPDLQSDFNTLLNSVRGGLRGVSDSESIGYYTNLADERKEYERKVRTVVRGISVFMRSLTLLNPLKYNVFAWQLLSHKLCRWVVPFALIIAFICNAVLAVHHGLYSSLFALQLAFYGIAILYIWSQKLPKIAMFRLPSFFVMVNVSILDAWVRYLRGDRILYWDPSKR